jgi:hypothetical protein
MIIFSWYKLNSKNGDVDNSINFGYIHKKYSISNLFRKLGAFIMRFLIILLCTSLAFIIGCSKDDNPTGPSDHQDEGTIVWEFEDARLSEDYYMVSESISLYSGEVSKRGYFDLKFKLERWTEHYGLELFVMEELEYAKYRESLDFKVRFRTTITSPGTHRYETDTFTGGHYRIVVDNTDYGWEDTDFDFVDDEAKFDFTVWLKE